MTDIEKLQNIINESENIVFFGGAGVSTESGLKDFRSKDGLYNEQYDYPPEEILSATFFYKHTDIFYKFYYEKLLKPQVKPNMAHYKLAEMEKKGKLTAVVTQNIDGLHQMAGSKTVYELHGTIHKNTCLNCGKEYDGEFVRSFLGNIPKCTCGGLIKPEVVLYQEGLDNSVVMGAIKAIANADTLIVAGTSLTVYPASGLVNYFNGKHLVVINKDKIERKNLADLTIYGKVGEVLSQIKI